jgi:hypothetical protein
MKNHFRQLLLVLLSFLLFLPILAQAVEIPNPLQTDTFEGLIDAIVKIIFNVALWIAPLMIIIAGFYFVTAAGNPTQINTAKQILFWTLIGFTIVVCATGVIALFKDILGVEVPITPITPTPIH